MLRIVVDTNIVVSSLWGGNARELIGLWQRGNLCLISSQEIIEEYLSVLSRFDLNKSDLKKWAGKFILGTEKIFPLRKIDAIKNDPKDNIFLECAVEGKADYIISGDKHLLTLRQFEKIPIIKVSAFLEGYYRNWKK